MKNCKIIFFILITILSSCEGDIYLTYHFTGLEIENAENIGELPQVSNADSIAKEAYAIRLNLFPVELSREGRYLDSETPPVNVNPIDSIVIYSDTKFNDTLLSGARLNSVFRIFNRNYLHIYPVGDLNIPNVYNTDFQDGPTPEYVDLLLMIPPDSSGVFKFYVWMRLEDGTQFLDSTENVKLF